MKYCHKCGKQLPGKALFCPYCKTKQVDLKKLETEAQNYVSLSKTHQHTHVKGAFCPYCKNTTGSSGAVTNQNVAIDYTSSSSKSWWIWAIALIVTILLVVGGIFFAKNYPTNHHSSSKTVVHKKISTPKLYNVKLTVIGNKDDLWNVSGTTNAPDGSKVVVVDPNDNYQLITNNKKVPTVSKGKFTGSISATTFEDRKDKVGDSFELFAVATPSDILSKNNITIDSTALPSILDDKFKQNMILTNTQIAYYNALYK